MRNSHRPSRERGQGSRGQGRKGTGERRDGGTPNVIPTEGGNDRVEGSVEIPCSAPLSTRPAAETAAPQFHPVDETTSCGAGVSPNHRWQRNGFRPYPREEAMNHSLAALLRDGRRPSATGWVGSSVNPCVTAATGVAVLGMTKPGYFARGSTVSGYNRGRGDAAPFLGRGGERWPRRRTGL